VNNNELDQNKQLLESWEFDESPGSEQTENVFSKFLQVHGKQRNVLNCAVPLARAKTLTDFEFPPGIDFKSCLVGRCKCPEALKDWNYTPKIRAMTQLPQMQSLPKEHTSLIKVPWFQTAAPTNWLGINGQHLRYHYQLWQDIKPKVLQGVQTTIVMALPQLGFTLTPHIQTEKLSLFLGSLARGLTPAQLFPARYLYPDANLGEMADMPAPMFSDILPTTGGYIYPLCEGEPDPWRVLTYYDKTDKFYGYPFSRVKDSVEDFTLNNCVPGDTLLPDGTRGHARNSQSYVYATLDPKLKEDLKLGRKQFMEANCLVRGTVTHDGLPFQLPVEMQTMVHSIMLTHWKMELDKPGELKSYTLTTEHAAIRGFNYYQKVEPFYTNFMRMIQELSKDPTFKTYPLASHLTDSWLGGNVRVSNQLSRSEESRGFDLTRFYYGQQLDWLMGVCNLMNHTAFRTKSDRAGLVSKTGREIERSLDLDGVAFHQMNSLLLNFDSHLFPRPLKLASCWPNIHPGWADLDKNLATTILPEI